MVSRWIELVGGYPPVIEGNNGGADRLQDPTASPLAELREDFGAVSVNIFSRA
jgi:hypothetical protein